jgi:hypothetical protein
MCAEVLPMSSRWVPVFQGTIPEVLVLQSNCEADGIPTFTPDLGIPYLAAADGVYSVRLMVPEDRLEDARSLVPESKRSLIPVVEPEAEELALMAGRVRICAVLLITAPLAVYFGLEYIKRMRAAAKLPQDHRLTLAAFWFSVAVSVSAPLVWLLERLHPGLWHGLGP